MMSNEVLEIIARTQVACEAEAVSMDLPPEAGADIFHYQAHKDDFATDAEFWNWVLNLVEHYGKENEDTLRALYCRISEIMGSYVKYFEQIENRTWKT